MFLQRVILIAGLPTLFAACSASTGSLHQAMTFGFAPAAPATGAPVNLFAFHGPGVPRVTDAAFALHDDGSRTPRPFKVASEEETATYDMVGMASWYGSAFHGHTTANGETFDRMGLTAAHPSLPLPSYVRVTNLENSRSVIVRVNDRGPFVGKRLIDVSEQTAELLAFRRSGSTRVRVEFVAAAPLHADDRAMLFASYRGPQLPKVVAAAPVPAPTVVAFASDESDDVANTAMQSLTSAYSPGDRIFMAFDVAGPDLRH